MKKNVSFVLSAILVLCLTACGSGNKNDTPKPKNPSLSVSGGYYLASVGGLAAGQINDGHCSDSLLLGLSDDGASDVTDRSGCAIYPTGAGKWSLDDKNVITITAGAQTAFKGPASINQSNQLVINNTSDKLTYVFTKDN